jgi:hypothetical protein
MKKYQDLTQIKYLIFPTYQISIFLKKQRQNEPKNAKIMEEYY